MKQFYKHFLALIISGFLVPTLGFAAPAGPNAFSYQCEYKSGDESYVAKGTQKLNMEQYSATGLANVDFPNSASLMLNVSIAIVSSYSYTLTDASSLLFPPGIGYGMGSSFAPYSKSATYSGIGQSFWVTPSGYLYEGADRTSPVEVSAACLITLIRQ